MMDVEVATDTIGCAQLKSESSTNQHPVFTGWIPFLSPNQQCQNTEGKTSRKAVVHKSFEQVQYRVSHDTAESVYQPWSGL